MSESQPLPLKWPTPSEFPPLGPNDVHVWAVPLDAGVPLKEEVAQTLSSEELQRAAGFALDKPRNAFVAARLALRGLLGRYLERPPYDLSIVVERNGKPRLAANDIEFNVSHSGMLALIAIARQFAVGVDVERVRPVDRLREIARRNFHPRELAAIRAARAEDSTAVFLRLWTRKEAVLKAIGAGLHYPLSAFHVLGGPVGAGHVDMSSPVVELSAHGDAPESRCFFHDVDPCDGYVAAVATRSARRPVFEFTYPL